MMRIRTGWGLLICCVALAACTAKAPKGPAATVTTPAVGRPPAPASVAAAMSSESFTAYAALGASDNDGLAPGDTYDALHTACMNDAGYGQYAADAPYPARTNRGLGFPQPYGPWGYVGTALAAEQGFLADAGPTPGPGTPGSPFSSLPTAAQAAAGKCFNILENFNNAQFAHSMAIVETLNNYISTDVIQDGEFKRATRGWSACMAKNGFSSPDPSSFWQRCPPCSGRHRPHPTCSGGPCAGRVARLSPRPVTPDGRREWQARRCPPPAGSQPASAGPHILMMSISDGAGRPRGTTGRWVCVLAASGLVTPPG
jgi:hypothetical protein